MHLLTTKFEILRMMEDEPIYDFNIRLCDIANDYLALREKMLKKSWLERFSYVLGRLKYQKTKSQQ